MQIARALHRLKPAIGLWLIAAPDPEAPAFPAIASIVRNWLLACPSDNDGLVAGYQHLKRAWVKGSQAADSISPAVYLLSHDYAHAAIVHKRLRKAALEFLGTDLPLAGAGPARHSGNTHPGEDAIRVMTLASEEPEDVLWAAVLDELCPMGEAEEPPPAILPAGAQRPAANQQTTGHRNAAPPEMSPRKSTPNDVERVLDAVQERAAELAGTSAKMSEAALDQLAHVLDPEEREALALGFEDGPDSPLPEKSHESAAHVASSRVRIPEPALSPPVIKSPPPLPQGTSAKAASAEKKPVTDAAETPCATPGPSAPITLRAFELDSSADRKSQWQAVEKSIWDLSPHSALLDARPPMSWASETCLSIDAAGCLNVWTLYRDGASWFALREWAHEHRNLLALTRRDLTIRPDAEVAVHIILPLDEDGSEPHAAAHQPPAHPADPRSAAASAPGLITMMMRTPVPHVFLYRLRRVQWNHKQGLLVVPIS